MKTKDILARVNDAMEPYSAIEQAESARSYNADYIASVMKERLAALRADLEAQVRLEIATSNGVASATRTITKMLNYSKKHDYRESLHYAWLDGQGRQCVCDGYRAFRLNDPLPLEPRPEGAGDTIDLDKIMPSGKDYAPVPLPSAKEIKAFIAVEKAKSGTKRGTGILWDFGEGRPVVNAEYLLDLVQVFPDAAEIFCGVGVNMMRPMFVHCERGDAILLPVRAARCVAEIAAIQQAKAEAERAIQAQAEAEGRDPEYIRERQARRAKRMADAEKALADRVAWIRAEMQRQENYSLDPMEFEHLLSLIDDVDNAA